MIIMDEIFITSQTTRVTRPLSDQLHTKLVLATRHTGCVFKSQLLSAWLQLFLTTFKAVRAQVRHKIKRFSEKARESLGRAFTARAMWTDDPQGTRGPPATALALHRSIACLLMFQGNKNATTLGVCTLSHTVSFRV